MGLKVLKTAVKSVRSILNQPLEKTVVDLTIRANIEADLPADWKIASARKEQSVYMKRRFLVDMNMRYILDIRPCCEGLCYGPIMAPVEAFPKDKFLEDEVFAADLYLLPMANRENYKKLCRQMLEYFYPEALGEAAFVDGMILAKRMNMKVFKRWFLKKAGKRPAHLCTTTVKVTDPGGLLWRTSPSRHHADQQKYVPEQNRMKTPQSSMSAFIGILLFFLYASGGGQEGLPCSFPAVWQTEEPTKGLGLWQRWSARRNRSLPGL
jgi:hypothetical protein